MLLALSQPRSAIVCSRANLHTLHRISMINITIHMLNIVRHPINENPINDTWRHPKDALA